MKESNEKNGSPELLTVLQGELALLRCVQELQARVKEAVERREWADFDEINGQIGDVSEKLSALEALRLSFGAENELSNDAGVKSLLREMKYDLKKVMWTGNAIVRYVESRENLAKSFIEAVYPEKRGAFYSRNGKKEGIPMKSLVLDTTL
jgi:hypothetical protein